VTKAFHALVVFVGLLAHASEAHAAPAIELVAPSGCPTETELDAQVRALAPTEVFANPRARAVVRRAPEGFRAELTLTVPDGTTRERTVQAETCETAVQALAVIFVASHAEIAASTPPAQKPPVSPPRPTAPRSEWQIALAAEAVADRGLLPDFVLGGMLEANLSKGWARAGIGLGALAPAEARSPFGATADIHALVADAGFCADGNASSFRLGACGGMSLLVLRGRGVTVDRAREEDRFVPAAKVALDARWPARSRFAARLSLVGRIPLARPEFSILNDGALHRPAAVCGEVVLGPEMRF
jgi:hypothetical protein